jgi:hypothetical protein
MREFWWVILFTLLLGAGCGAAFGLARNPTYNAEARMSVGRLDVATQSIPGFTEASLTLADTYSRAIDAGSVVKRVSKASGLTPREVISDVTASPIPQTQVVRVFATGSTGPRAIGLANSASRGLIAYVHNLNRFNPDSKHLLARYRRASQAFSAALAAQQNGASDAEAQARVGSTRLQVQTAGQLYQSSQAGQAAPNTLQPLAFATDASSDFSSTLQRAIFAGLIGGLLLGSGTALFLAYRY